MSDIVYMFAMSLDGFIARPDGSVDWLEAFPANDDFDFAAFEATVTGIVMGRGSYEAARRGGQWQYGRWPVLVATGRPIDDAPAGVKTLAGPPAAQIARLRDMGATGRIWMFGGGDLVRQYLNAGLLDTVEIGIIPVLLGEGIPAFGGAQPDRWLELESARPLKNGAVHSRYRVQRVG